MAINTAAGSTNFYSRSASMVSATAPRPITIMLKFKASDRTVRNALLNNNYNSSGPRLYVDIEPSGANNVQRLYSGAFVSSSTFVLSTTAYTTLGWTWDTDDSVAFFLNGAANGTTTKTVGGTATDGAAVGVLVSGLGTFTMSGDLAELAVWNAIKTVEAHKSFHVGAVPPLIDIANLTNWVRWIKNPASEIEQVGGLAWTKVNTVTKADHPAMMEPALIGIYPNVVAAVGGGRIMSSLAGIGGGLAGRGGLAGAHGGLAG